MKNDRIMIIGDTHAPYHHQDAIPFLEAMKRKYKPTRVVHIGDEVDRHKISFHDSDPDLMSDGDEIRESRVFLHELEKMFPKMDLLESNHGSLHYRKAFARGLSVENMRTYHELWQVGKGWEWHPEMKIRLPNKQWLYLNHGKSTIARKIALIEGCNVIQGHYHSQFCVDQWANSEGKRMWGMQVGCLVDTKSLAMKYSKNFTMAYVMGSAMVIDSEPLLVPMKLNKRGRWIGKL